MAEILVSRGFGAGWSTWGSDDHRIFVLGHRPLIEALKRGEKVWTDADEAAYPPRDDATFVPSHPAMQQFVADFAAKFGADQHFYLGGADGLDVEVIGDDCLFRVNEYDGRESVEIMSADNFLPASALARASA